MSTPKGGNTKKDGGREERIARRSSRGMRVQREQSAPKRRRVSGGDGSRRSAFAKRRAPGLHRPLCSSTCHCSKTTKEEKGNRGERGSSHWRKTASIARFSPFST